MNGWTDRSLMMSEWMNGWTDRWIDGWMNTARWINGCMNERNTADESMDV